MGNKRKKARVNADHTPIIGGHVPRYKRPVTGMSNVNDEWAFSFRYFRQAEFFGLNSVPKSWTVSMLERLATLSADDKSSFLRDAVKKDELRYHEIDWSARGIPVNRSFFNWIPPEIINNEEEFPFMQFHISQALGRIVGFWSKDSSLFYIMIMDPMHNLQPSKYSDYKVRSASILESEYSSLLLKLQHIKSARCSNEDCKISQAVRKLADPFEDTNFFFFAIEDDYLESLKATLKNASLRSIIELGILAQNSNK